MPDIQTTEYRATQLVYSIKFKLSHTILYCPQKKDMWPSTGLCFTENHPSVSIIHIQSQIVFIAVFFLCFYGKPPLCLSWFSSGSTLSFHQTHPITNCTCLCVFSVLLRQGASLLVLVFLKIDLQASQGCISCGILLSGTWARGVSSEHMENMEMFSCSPT